MHTPASYGTAHPRSRGENADSIRSIKPVGGSSPLTRGKRLRGHVPRGRPRLIPAHAGKTRMVAVAGMGCPAHPRSRGENLKPLPPAPERAGSSPLTRGKLTVSCQTFAEVRLIPAHAGKTSSPPLKSSKRRAHPRSRGENLIAPEMTLTSVGSSPLTRGKHGCRGRSLVGLRLIPAHAGKTFAAALMRPLVTAHPRSRGENSQSVRGAPATSGSSPLTRGKHGVRLFRHCLFRLIPAHAGKTDAPRRSGAR